MVSGYSPVAEDLMPALSTAMPQQPPRATWHGNGETAHFWLFEKVRLIPDYPRRGKNFVMDLLFLVTILAVSIRIL